jgi:hypothetical protein
MFKTKKYEKWWRLGRLGGKLESRQVFNFVLQVGFANLFQYAG